jgi:ParB family chromosome partitioning protein
MKTGRRIPEIDSVAVAEVAASERLRPVSEAGVAALMASIAELGVMQDPIHVRRVRHRDNALVLMAGAHRLEAARRLGWTDIPATVWECNDAWARMMEIDDNLAGAELTALDSAVFLAARKRLYEAEHPDARQGVAGALALHKNHATDIVSVASFAASTAEKFNLSERHVYRMVAAGSALAPDEVARLRAGPRPVGLADLQVIAKAGPAERYGIVDALAAGRAKTAKQALALGAEAPPKDPVEAAFQRLLETFDRAPAAARRRFVEERGTEIAALTDGRGA